MAITKPIQVEVVRKKWYRGKGGDDSRLLCESGQMCCIGFLARRLGYKPREIRDVSTLVDTEDYLKVDSFAYEQDSILCDCYEVNDDTAISDATRERKLTALGKKMGVRFTFVD